MTSVKPLRRENQRSNSYKEYNINIKHIIEYNRFSKRFVFKVFIFDGDVIARVDKNIGRTHSFLQGQYLYQILLVYYNTRCVALLKFAVVKLI